MFENISLLVDISQQLIMVETTSKTCSAHGGGTLIGAGKRYNCLG